MIGVYTDTNHPVNPTNAFPNYLVDMEYINTNIINQYIF